MDTTSHLTADEAGPAIMRQFATDTAFGVFPVAGLVNCAAAVVREGEAVWQFATTFDRQAVIALVKPGTPPWVTNPDMDTADLLRVLDAQGEVREALIIAYPATDQLPADFEASGPFEDRASGFPNWL